MATIEQAVGGVSFALSDEQKELRALAREFAEKEIRPKAAEYDEHSTHPADVIAKAHELGLMNLHVPEELGGLGLSAFDGMLVGEELTGAARGWAPPSARTASAPGPCCSRAATTSGAEWLPPLLDEPILCSFGLSEPDAGSDVARMKTTAVRRGDEYVLNGSKTFITNAGHAAWTVVFAKTDPKQGPSRHLGLRRADGHPGRDDREAPRQDGPALDRHVRVRAHRRRRAGGEPPRRGGRRLQDRDADARLHAARHGRRRRRRRPGRLRARGRVREGARHLRRADRDAPGRQLPDRRHGHRDRSRAAARLAVGLAARPGQARHAPVVARQALLRRHGR